MAVVLAQFSPINPATGNPVTIRLTSANDARVTSLNGVAWTPGLMTKGSLSLTLFDDSFPGKIATGVGAIVASLPAMPGAAVLQWNETPVTLWTGNVGDPWSSYTQIFTGLVLSFSTSAGKATIALRVADNFLDQPLLVNTYAGTGGIEGDVSLKGTPKPLAIGAPQFIEPVLIDAVNSVYQFSGYGAVQGVTNVYDRLSRYPASVGDVASYAALVAATVPTGRYATALSAGLIKLGAPPAGPLTLSVQGDNSGVGGWVRTAGAVIRRLAQIAGYTTQVNTASLAALDTSSPFPLSLYVTDQVTLRDLASSVAGSLNCALGIGWDGKLFVSRPVIAATPALTLNTNGASLPQVKDVAMLQTSVPYWRLQQEAARAWRVHGTNEIAYSDTLVPLGDYNAATTYRGGNIVNYQAAQYLYINATPAAGNLPTNATYWTLFEGAPQYSEVGGNDKPTTFLIAAAGLSATGVPRSPGFYKGDGTLVYSISSGYNIAAYVSGAWQYRSYFPYAGGTNASDMASYLTGLANGTPIVIYTWDEPATNRLTSGLDQAMYHCGASTAVYGDTTNFHIRGAYILIGQAGTGAGNGTEYYAGSVDSDPNAWLDVAATMINGVFTSSGNSGVNTGGIPGATGPAGQSLYTWVAYSDSADGTVNFTNGAPGGRAYEGVALNKASATESSTPTDYSWSPYFGPAAYGLYANGRTTISGNRISSDSTLDGTNFNGGAYSTEGYVGACSMSFRANQTNGGFMFGLNTDPATDNNWTSLDYAFHPYEAGTYGCYYGNGGGGSPTGTYTTGTIFQIVNDNAGNVYFNVNGTNVLTLTGQPINARYYFDSAFRSPNISGTLLSFVPGGVAGVQGPQGVPGINGLPGAPGANGVTYYPYYAYSNASNGSIDFLRSVDGPPGGRAYIGYANGTSPIESSTYTDYLWTAYAGPANYGLIAAANCVVAGTTIISTLGGDSWSAVAYSDVGYRNGAFVTATKVRGPGGVFFGLCQNPATTAHPGEAWKNVTFAWYFDSAGSYSEIRVTSPDGTILSEPGMGSYDGEWNFSVEYDGGTGNVYFFRNSVLVYTYAWGVTGATLYLNVAMVHPASRVTISGFGPASASGLNGSPGATGAPGAPGAPSTVPGPVGPQGPQGPAANSAGGTARLGSVVSIGVSAGGSISPSGQAGYDGGGSGGGRMQATLLVNGSIIAYGNYVSLLPGEPDVSPVSGTWTNTSGASVVVDVAIGYSGTTGARIVAAQTFVTV